MAWCLLGATPATQVHFNLCPAFSSPFPPQDSSRLSLPFGVSSHGERGSRVPLWPWVYAVRGVNPSEVPQL